jgi:hypothetical protein
MTGTRKAPTHGPTSPAAQAKLADAHSTGKEMTVARDTSTAFDIINKYISFPTIDQEQ